MKKFLVFYIDHCHLNYHYPEYFIVEGESLDDAKVKIEICNYLFGMHDGDFHAGLSLMFDDEDRLKEGLKRLKIFEIVSELNSKSTLMDAVYLAKDQWDKIHEKLRREDQEHRRELYEKLKKEFGE